MESFDYQCQVCSKPGATLFCDGCAAMPYCCDRHRSLHRAAGHGEECARMATQMKRLQALVRLPFDFVDRHSSVRDLLDSLNIPSAMAWSALRNGGIWTACMLLPQLLSDAAAAGTVASATRAQLSALLPSWLHLELRDMPCLLSAAPSVLQRPACRCARADATAESPTDWASYYEQRGIRAGSPIALLMDAVMTVHWAAQLDNRLDPAERLTVHLLGADQEFDMWPLFLELGCLWPGGVDLHMIGTELPHWAHARSLTVPGPESSACGRPGCSCAAQPPLLARACNRCGAEPASVSRAGNMTLTFWRGEYHAACTAHDLPKPDLVVGPNAGLAAFPSWLPTLSLLQEHAAGKLRPPLCVYTDYNEEAVHRAVCMLESALGHPEPRERGILLNPFRQPFLLRPTDNRLPAMSNAFALCTHAKSSHTSNALHIWYR